MPNLFEAIESCIINLHLDTFPHVFFISTHISNNGWNTVFCNNSYIHRTDEITIYSAVDD